MAEICERVPSGFRRIPDGETGDRQQWILFQLQKFMQTPGLEEAQALDQPSEGYEQMPRMRLAEGVAPEAVEWPNPGYADAYQESFQTFVRLRQEGIIPAGVRFQVEYPTPLASINAWIRLEDQDRLEPSYERALFADLDRLLGRLPHDDISIQWDVAVEFAILEGGFEATEGQTFDAIIQRLARCVDQVPEEVPVGLHLCYGDYGHRHFKEPESLELQVRVANRVSSEAHRPVSWFSFTVPQYQREASYFAPLGELKTSPQTELYFALVPYHTEEQQPGNTGDQVRLVDEYLTKSQGNGAPGWGICTECGMGRAEREEVPQLLDMHQEILARYSPQTYACVLTIRVEKRRYG
jgi:hypothetical protein